LKLSTLTLGLIAAAALTLTACSKTEAPSAKTATAQSAPTLQSYDAVAAQGKGFTVGAMMSANTVYVMFDPQCPHCGHLWEAAKPLLKKVKFVWLPVSIINGNSAPQGAALMSAANPTELMNAHETSILAGTGGLKATSSSTAEVEQAIKKNTELFNGMGIESVPYIMAKNSRTGQLVTNSGALSTQALADFLGVD
jgi:thiol:disulfide interchange protein DsbG